MRRYTVRQLCAEVNAVLTERYPLLEVEGEVTGRSVPASGHGYLTMTEGDTQLSVVFWRATWNGLGWQPKIGDKVVVRGKMGSYKSQFQVIGAMVSPLGAGAWAAELARRRARLESEGLLDPRRKRPLPTMPRVVGVATSLTGAALQDFLKVSRDRFPAARIVVGPCVVQGAAAPASVQAAVELLLEEGRAELIVVTRGGGSKEDLVAFHDEGLARFLAHAPVPIVSAVGHQIDTTLCDLVADCVAATPSEAAVLALPDAGMLAQRVDGAALALEAALRARLQRARLALQGAQQRLRHPSERLALVRRRAREASERLAVAMRGRLQAARLRVTPLAERLEARTQRQLERSRTRVVSLEARARALSPTAVLARGFAVVTSTRGVVTDADGVRTGERLRIRLARGTVDATALAPVASDVAEGS
jgi:exodeoxyribonuclease VII large subunit